MIENTLDFYIQLERYFPMSASEEQKKLRLETYANRLDEYLKQRPESYSLDRLLDVLVETHKYKELPLFANILDKLPLAKERSGFNFDSSCASLWVQFKNQVWTEFILPKGMPPSTAIDIGKRQYRGSVDWVYCPIGKKFDTKNRELISYEQELY